MKKVILLIFGLALYSGLLHSQQKELKVLFVGNSYTYGYNLPHIVSIISEETSTKLVTRKSVIGGASLQEHWKGGRELETKKIIAEGDFDIVVLQDFSMSAIHSPDSTIKYVKLFTEYNKSFEICKTVYRIQQAFRSSNLLVQYLGPGKSTTVSG